MKYILKLSILPLLISCNLQDNNSVKAQKWLIRTIEKVFTISDGSKDIYTKEYSEYKHDAIDVAYETNESLTEQQFKKKWKDKFDIKYAGIGNGFIISGQDWSKIKVTQCELLSKTGNNYTFKVLIEDIGEGYKQKYHRDITVIHQNNRFLISDIREYD